MLKIEDIMLKIEDIIKRLSSFKFIFKEINLLITHYTI